ncbi:MAG TPA: 4'-phosphopantetheinyl transferase superfamily protein [Rhodanobacteraceae bacterium]|nr:4'-phosphopantetheinyl transferase superfamily protein [Rhodanobacteraceae bacterium]
MSAPARALDDDAIHVHWRRRSHTDGRAPLLRVLGDYLALTTDAVPLRQASATAKPQLAPPFDWLCFNWSHSGPWAVIAVARGLPLGVDVEHSGRPRDTLAIAQRFYAETEYAALATMEPTARDAMFRRWWTIKEAVIKACGSSLGRGLSQVAIAVGDPGFSLTRAPLGDPSLWRVHSLATPATDCDATLAWYGAPRRVVVCGAQAA